MRGRRHHSAGKGRVVTTAILCSSGSSPQGASTTDEAGGAGEAEAVPRSRDRGVHGAAARRVLKAGGDAMPSQTDANVLSTQIPPTRYVVG